MKYQCHTHTSRLVREKFSPVAYKTLHQKYGSHSCTHMDIYITKYKRDKMK